MARHDIEMEIPPKVVLNSDVRFVVRSDGVKLGELLVSKGSVAWIPGHSPQADPRAVGAVRRADARRTSTAAAPMTVIDPLFDDDGARAMVELCERFGRYRMYLEHEQLETEIGAGLAQRQDALSNFLRTGGLRACRRTRRRARGADQLLPRGVRVRQRDPHRRHRAVPAPRRVRRGGAGDPRPAVIEPAIAYANLMVPGQELAVHTDVPEFRGANRKLVPQWLLVVMLHSGCFDEYRMPIATAIAWFHDCDGGALAYWPDGPPTSRSGTRCVTTPRWCSTPTRCSTASSASPTYPSTHCRACGRA